jgi:hypothetical protein
MVALLDLNHLVHLGPLPGLCFSHGAFAPLREDSRMKAEELKEALRLIRVVSNDPRLGPGQRDQLQKARRELEVVSRTGKAQQRRAFRAVEIVATVLLDIVENEAR